MRKNKINVCELAARKDYTDSLKENIIEQANLLKPSNAKLNNVDKQIFEMGLETDATIESLATLTIYNWQSADTMDNLAFLATLHI